jgi:hypothetical protein
MKIALAISALIAALGGCVIVPVDYGYRGDRPYYRGGGYYGGDRYYRGYYRGDGYYSYRSDRYYRGYGYQDHGQ